MSRKTALFLAILTAVVLTACGENSAETVIETEQVTTVSEVATTAEKIVETTATEAETSATETEAVTAETASEENVLPVVFSADEKYEHYPLEVIYPEVQEAVIAYSTETVREDLFNTADIKITEFSADYPVFEGTDEAVFGKINDAIKAYVDEAYEYEKNYAAESGYDDDGVYNEEIVDIYEKAGRTDERMLSFEIDSVCGNILSVCVTDYRYMAGAAHGYPSPVPMMFDLRTGEQIKLSEMVVDKMAFSERFMASISGMTFAVQLERENYTMAEYYDFFMNRMTADPGEEYGVDEYGVDENGELIIGFRKADTRLTVKNGCVGFYVAPYEYGSYADGIRLAEVPIDDLLPYMNDEGKALFEGVVSATAEPVMLTVEDGKEKIISREQAEEMLSEREE